VVALRDEASAILAVVVAAGIYVLTSNATPVSGAILLVGYLGVLLLNVIRARRR